jgi:hypothetical protein
LRGEALQGHGRGLAEVDPRGELDEPVGGDEALLRIRAVRAVVADAVAGADHRHVRSDGDDRAGPFAAGDKGKVGRLVEADAVINVDEIQPDRLMPDAGLARPGIADFDIFPLQDFRTAMFVDDDCFGHDFSSSAISSQARVEYASLDLRYCCTAETQMR